MSRVKWTYEICENESRKYKSFSEFNTNNYLAYRKAYENDWLKNFNWLKDDRGFYDTITKMYSVYKYEWVSTNTVYVGLTKNLRERDKGHRKIAFKKGKEYKSSVKIYSEENDLEIPLPTILENNLNSIEAREKEDYWVNHYKKLGFNVINKAKTGVKSGSIGGPIKKWDYELCYNGAKKCKTRSEFQSMFPGAYRVARNSGWLEDYVWMPPQIHPNGYWNKERCYDEAKKYEFWDDFRKKSHSAYDSAKNNEWLSDYSWLKLKVKPNGYWTFEKCLEEAKKYGSLTEFRTNSAKAYSSAIKKRYINKIKEELWKC